LIGGFCDGSCCEFGNSDCDLYEGDIFANKEGKNTSAGEEEFTMPAVSSLQATSSSESGISCGTGCIAFAVVAPVLVVCLALLGFRSYRKIRNDRDVNLGNAPTNPIA